MEYKLVTVMCQLADYDPVGRASKEIATKVNEAIKEGYRTVGKVKILILENKISLLQQMIKE